MSSRTHGRHRAPGRFNPAVSLSAAAVRNAGPAMQAGAVIAASGGMVASLTMPAQAVALPESPEAVSSGVMTETRNTVKPATVTMAKATSVTATTGRTVPVEGSTEATAPDGDAVQTVESSLRSAVLSSERVAKLLDRRTVRSRSERAGAELNRAFPEVTRRNLGMARRLSTARALTTAQGAGALGIASGLSGIWYRWGGTTPSGFDCSGFTSYVYRKMGIRLPRTAAAQQAYTKRVKTPRPGDLVFFGSPAHHVGIYAGSGMMYDAPRSGKKTGLRKIYTSRVGYGRIG